MTCTQMFGYSATPSASSLPLSAVYGSGRRKLVKSIFMVACLCLAVFSLCFSPSSANAWGIGATSTYSIQLNGFNFITSDSSNKNPVESGCRMGNSSSLADIGFRFCSLPVSDSARILNGVSAWTPGDNKIPTQSVVTLNITIANVNVSSSGSNLVGFRGNGQWDVLDQDITTTGLTDTMTFNFRLVLYYHGASPTDLIPLTAWHDGQIITYTGSPYSSNKPQIGMTNPTVMTFIKTESIQEMLANVDSIEDVVKQIRDGGIKATVDQSGVISSVNNAANQAHKDSQNQLNATNNAANQAHKDSQAQLDEQKKANQIAEEQKNFVTDTSTPEAGDIANSESLPSVGLLPPGPLDSLLLLPVNILNSIIQSFGGSCKPVVAPLPFVGDQELTFPCFTDTFYTGSFAPLATAIGGVASAFILFGYFKHLYKKVDRAVSLETTDEDEWGIL